MKLIKLITFSILNCSSIYASASPDYRDYKYCTLAVQFEKIGESNFKVKSINPSSVDALKRSYVAEFDKLSADDWVVSIVSNSAGKFNDGYGRIETTTRLTWNDGKCNRKNNIWGCYLIGSNGVGYTFDKLMKTNSWQMISNGFNNDFLTSEISKPYIESCNKYIRWDKENKAEALAKDKAKEESDKQAQQSFTHDLITATNRFRLKLKPSDITNCGTVIELKGKGNQKMIHVQTGSDARDIWIGITNIYPQNINNYIIGCRDTSRWYKRYGNWTQDGGRSTFSNYGIKYYDFE